MFPENWKQNWDFSTMLGYNIILRDWVWMQTVFTSSDNCLCLQNNLYGVSKYFGKDHQKPYE